MKNYLVARGPAGFRGYRFYAGRLRDKLLCDITDKQLDWAIRFNEDYIRDHQDPQEAVSYMGRTVSVSMLPAGVAERRIAQAELALHCCRSEKMFRFDEREAGRTVAPAEKPKARKTAPPTHSPADLLHMARRQAAIQVASRLERLSKNAGAFGADQLGRDLGDLAAGLRAAFQEEP